MTTQNWHDSRIPLFAGIVLFALGSGLVEPSLQSRP
jgi:hypothetical protein